jgi:hypothetical protein
MLKYHENPTTDLLKSLKCESYWEKQINLRRQESIGTYLLAQTRSSVMQVVPKDITEIVPCIFVHFYVVSAAANLKHIYYRVNIRIGAATESHGITTLTT